MQTVYLDYMKAGFPGMKADSSDVDDVRTHASGEAATEIPFGVVVAKKAATDVGVVLPTALADVLLGVVVHSHDYAKGYELGSVGLKPQASLSVMNKGKIYVTVEDAVVAGNRAFSRYAGAGQKGAFRGAAVANETVELKGCRYLTSAAAGGLAVLEVDFNVVRATQP